MPKAPPPEKRKLMAFLSAGLENTPVQRDQRKVKLTPAQKKAARRAVEKLKEPISDSMIANCLTAQGLGEIMPAPKKAGRQPDGIVEYRRRQVNVLYLMGMSHAQMAKTLNVSESTIKMDIQANKQHVRDDVWNMDYSHYVGTALSTYELVKQAAYRMLHDPGADHKVQAEAMRIILAAETHKGDFVMKVNGRNLPQSPIPVAPQGEQPGAGPKYDDEADFKEFVRRMVAPKKPALIGVRVIEGESRIEKDAPRG